MPRRESQYSRADDSDDTLCVICGEGGGLSQKGLYNRAIIAWFASIDPANYLLWYVDDCIAMRSCSPCVGLGQGGLPLSRSLCAAPQATLE